MRVAVTGASGKLGGQVVRLLAQQAGIELVALSRGPTVVPCGVTLRNADYGHLDTLRRSLADVDTLVFISSDGEGTHVLSHHLNVVAAAVDAKVSHIVALSGIDADTGSPFCYAITNGYTEQAIRASGCGYSIARASIFAEFFRHFLLPAQETGQIGLPAGTGRISLVSRADVGRCLAALAVVAPTGRHHDITGTCALDLADMAALAGDLWGRPVTYSPISPAQHLTELAGTEDAWWMYAYTSMFASIREHRWDHVSDDVQHLTGRAPQALTAVLGEPV